jgi:hypothetical protein
MDFLGWLMTIEAAAMARKVDAGGTAIQLVMESNSKSILNRLRDAPASSNRPRSAPLSSRKADPNVLA